jgi:1-acyl-sn-glycerol-3-phosphate acyltransferase
VRSWFYHPGSAIIGGFCRLVFGLRVEGVERIPRSGAFIVVANHCSNLDPPMLGWATGHQVGRVVHFMAKIEMRSWPLIGWLATQSGVYFVRRGEADRAAQRFSLGALADGRPIAIFPEGTRSRDGRMRDFKDGAAVLAVRSGAPVLPVGIAGSDRMFPGRSRWPHRTRVVMRIGDPFTLEHQGEGRLNRQGLTEATRRIEAAVAALLPVEQRPERFPAGGTVADSDRPAELS